MRKIGVVLASVALASGILLFGAYPGLTSSMRKAKAQSAPAQPNIVFILTDDMRKDDLRFMPQTKQLLQNRGKRFDDAFVSCPLCTPSRSSILRGQYPHNTGVEANKASNGGGYDAFVQNNLEADTMGTRMQDAGYRTGFFGKYMNGYNTPQEPGGWDRWFAHIGAPNYFNYNMSVDGTKVHYGTDRSDYEADVVQRAARSFIGSTINQGSPFLAYVAPKAPHTPNIPAPRDEHTYDSIKAPHPASYDEENIGDKPPWIRQLPRLDANDNQRINERYEGRAESLQAVDDLVGGLVDELKADGQLSNTYIFFTSDNGWHLGEHRIPNGKDRPYEEDQNMPLLVRGPGVAAGVITHKLALNTDYLPTFTAIAGAPRPYYTDGRSLLPVLNGTASDWRTGVLIEGAGYSSDTPHYEELRLGVGKSYTEYVGGQKEFYNLGTDPRELVNKYDASSPPNALASRLRALEACSGGGCVAAEDGR